MTYGILSKTIDCYVSDQKARDVLITLNEGDKINVKGKIYYVGDYYLSMNVTSITQ